MAPGVLLFVLWLAFAAAGACIGSAKGRWLAGFLLGGLLSGIGLVIIACVPPTDAKKVERGLREQAIAAEVARRWQGGQPPAGHLPPAERPAGPQPGDTWRTGGLEYAWNGSAWVPLAPAPPVTRQVSGHGQ